MEILTGGPFLITLGLFALSVVDDLRSRKVQNRLITWIFVLALVTSFASWGLSNWVGVLTSFVSAFVFCLPLYLMRIIGGGDVKLMIAISPLLTWQSLGLTLLSSFFWGALLGLLVVILKGELKSFLQNILSVALQNKVQKENLHKIPYTVALLFGFLTQWTLSHLPGWGLT